MIGTARGRTLFFSCGPAACNPQSTAPSHLTSSYTASSRLLSTLSLPARIAYDQRPDRERERTVSFVDSRARQKRHHTRRRSDTVERRRLIQTHRHDHSRPSRLRLRPSKRRGHDHGPLARAPLSASSAATAEHSEHDVDTFSSGRMASPTTRADQELRDGAAAAGPLDPVIISMAASSDKSEASEGGFAPPVACSVFREVLEDPTSPIPTLDELEVRSPRLCRLSLSVAD